MPLRLLLLKCFGAMCNLDAAVISTLVNSVLPMELARDMQTHTQGEPELLFPGPWECVFPLHDLLQQQWPPIAWLFYMPCARGAMVSGFKVIQVITAVSGECTGRDASVQRCKALQLLNVPFMICVTSCRCLKTCFELFQFCFIMLTRDTCRSQGTSLQLLKEIFSAFYTKFLWCFLLVSEMCAG